MKNYLLTYQLIWHWIGINDKWNHISKKCDISKEEFLTGVYFILDSTYFSFDNTIYKLELWHAHGISLVSHNCELGDTETGGEGLEVVPRCILYYRYVDDLCTMVSI